MGNPTLLSDKRIVVVILCLTLAATLAVPTDSNSASIIPRIAASLTDESASPLQPHSPISIQGNAGFISANGVISGIGTAANPYVIEGWNITMPCNGNSCGGTGILVSDTTDHFVIRNVYVTDARFGIGIHDVINARVEDVKLVRNLEALAIFNSTNIIVVNGNFLFGKQIGMAAGIGVANSSRVLIESNMISSNGGPGINGNYGYGITGQQVSDIRLVGNTILQNSCFGVTFSKGHNLVIVNNKIIDNGCLEGGVGLILDSLGGFVLSGNVIEDNSWGMFISNSRDALISANNISRNGGDGIDAIGNCGVLCGRGLNDSQIIGNIVRGNAGKGGGDGIRVVGSRNLISGNNVTGNSLAGIAVYSPNSVITNNWISHNGFGLMPVSCTLPPQGFIAGVLLYRSNNTRVYHNNLISNACQAVDGDSSGVWDNGYPSGGNFWSDYTGVDKCSGPNQNICPGPDGIGDTPYTFASSMDRFPLMRPFASPLNTTVSYRPSLISAQEEDGYLTAAVLLPRHVNGTDIVSSSIRLNNTLVPVPGSVALVTRHGVQVLVARFNMTQLTALFSRSGSYMLSFSANIVTRTAFRSLTASGLVHILVEDNNQSSNASIG